MTVESFTEMTRPDVPGPSEDATGAASLPHDAPTELPLPQSVASVAAPAPLPTWTHRVYTIGGEVYESKVVNHKSHGVVVVLGRRNEVFIPYFGMDRIESFR